MIAWIPLVQFLLPLGVLESRLTLYVLYCVSVAIMLTGATLLIGGKGVGLKYAFCGAFIFVAIEVLRHAKMLTDVSGQFGDQRSWPLADLWRAKWVLLEYRIHSVGPLWAKALDTYHIVVSPVLQPILLLGLGVLLWKRRSRAKAI